MTKFEMFETLYNLKLKHSIQISNFKFIISVAVLTILLLFANTKLAFGQIISLSIWPPLLEVTMAPGKSVTQTYKLTNNTDSFLNITPQIFPFEPKSESGQIIIKHDSPQDFFSFSSGEKVDMPFLMDPGQSKDINLKISLPKSSPEKDYYFTLFFSTSADSKSNATHTSSVMQIGTNILLTSSVTENPPLLARITEFSSPKIIDSLSPVSFVVKIENWGKTYFKPFGKIEVKGILKQKEEIKLLEQNVLASSIRKLDLPSFKPKYPIGPFKAKLEFYLTEGKTDTPLSSEIVFWYFPYKILGGILLVLLVIKVIGFVKQKR